MDVYSRKNRAWGISNTLEAALCARVRDEAIDRYGCPEIINSVQGSQYTSQAWTAFLKKKDSKISMDGKGRATDNSWIERFWRTIKKNYLYLNPAETGTELYQQVEHYITYYINRFHEGIKTKPKSLMINKPEHLHWHHDDVFLCWYKYPLILKLGSIRVELVFSALLFLECFGALLLFDSDFGVVELMNSKFIIL